MGLRGEARIVGIAERQSERKFTGTPTLSLEQWAGLAADALADAGIDSADVDGVVCAGDVRRVVAVPPRDRRRVLRLVGELRRACRSRWCVGRRHGVARRRGHRARDLRGRRVRDRQSAAAAVTDPTAARRRARCSARRAWSGAHPRPSSTFPTATWRRTAATRCTRSATTTATDGTSVARAKIAADQRVSACANPAAVFYGTADHRRRRARVASHRRATAPARDRHAVHGWRRVRADDAARARDGAAAVGARRRVRRATHAQDADLRRGDAAHAGARRGRRVRSACPGLVPADIDMVQLYDCYTITALLTIEDSGFCGEGEGLAFVHDHDLSYRGDFPCNTHGGQLGMGQTGLSGGMSHVLEGGAPDPGSCRTTASWRATRPPT